MTSGIVQLTLTHRARNTERITVHALIVPRICSLMPDRLFESPFDNLLQRADLADPTYCLPGEIHLLLGADVWAKIVNEGIHRMQARDRTVVAQATMFGYVVFGQMASAKHVRIRSCHISSEVGDTQLDQMLIKFWNADIISEKRQWTLDEQLAGDIFRSTHQRGPNGRYIVRIPLRADAPALGNSRRAAKACFLSMERKLQSNPELGQYINLYLTTTDMRSIWCWPLLHRLTNQMRIICHTMLLIHLINLGTRANSEWCSMHPANPQTVCPTMISVVM